MEKKNCRTVYGQTLVELGKKYNIPLPIVDQVNAILFEGKDPKVAVNELMVREGKIEHSALDWEE